MEKLRTELKEKMFGYVATALGLVAGLAWNDAIKSFIEYILPLGTGTLLLKFIYAIVVTIVIVIAGYNITRFLGEQKDEQNK